MIIIIYVRLRSRMLSTKLERSGNKTADQVIRQLTTQSAVRWIVQLCLFLISG